MRCSYGYCPRFLDRNLERNTVAMRRLGDIACMPVSSTRLGGWTLNQVARRSPAEVEDSEVDQHINTDAVLILTRSVRVASGIFPTCVYCETSILSR